VTLRIRTHAWKVIVEAPFVIPYDFRKQAIQGLQDCWLLPGLAKMLRRKLRHQGYNPRVLKAEFRLCDICNRPLLGMEATNRRILLQHSPAGELIPCSPRCQSDLEMALWTKLLEVA
jgi:hypothetical protein